jgi:glutathione S-transferase
MTDACEWEELCAVSALSPDLINGPSNAQSYLRLFGKSEFDVKLTLFRDYHCWCPYCQKVWLWLEEKRIPYKVKKVTMFCYGVKEDWYKCLVPSGMLPAIDLDGQIITESDDILCALESKFGILGYSMTDRNVLAVRRLERQLFGAWCGWLCHPARGVKDEHERKENFIAILDRVNHALSRFSGDYFLDTFSSADVIFVPYLERMSASLFYYKGYNIRDSFPSIERWFAALEQRESYRGTQSDFHTHVHDLPPQMGACYISPSPLQEECMRRVDRGPWTGELSLREGGYFIPETSLLEEQSSEFGYMDPSREAVWRVCRHHQALLRVAPSGPTPESADQALRCVLTSLVTGHVCPPPPGTALTLRYLRDHISVPRDMSLFAARRLRSAAETHAALVGDEEPPPLPTTHRKDQNPANFQYGCQFPSLPS